MRGNVIRPAAAAAPLVLLLAACGGGSDPFEDDGGGADGGAGDGEAGEVIVGSADFPESVLLGNIYAQALEAAGVEVATQLGIGSREVYFQQVESGELTVFPEYNGGILFFLDPEAEAGDTEETNASIAELLPDGLEILDSAEAENKDSLTVTTATAEEHDLNAIGDLEPVAGDLTLGAPPEFEERPQGVPGLESVYGLDFADFRALDAALVPAALDGDDVQVANLFTTDPALATHDFVVLEDTENLFGAQNITPLVHADSVDDTVRDTLDAISAELDTDTLVELNERVIVGEQDPDTVAADWLGEVGLD